MNKTDLKINIAGLVPDSIVDGPGIRFTVFCQGCAHNCPGCHNPQTHPFNAGKDYTVLELIKKIQENPLCKGVTFSGGDPMFQPEGFSALAEKLKSLNYEIACYTGFTWEALMKDKSEFAAFRLELLKNIDVLIDGPFVLEKKNLDLLFRGSSNQRIIDVQKSLIHPELPPVLCTQKRWCGRKK